MSFCVLGLCLWHVFGDNETVVSYIYILSNKAFLPGILKIGLTSHTPQKRAKELYSTGVPVEFDLEQAWRVPEDELQGAERDIHRILSEYRFNKKREFFLIEREQAIDTVSRYIKDRGFRNTHVSMGLGAIDKLLLVAILAAVFICGYWVTRL